MAAPGGRQLSKGTLGLKFMNKVKPVDPAAASTSNTNPSKTVASSSTTSSKVPVSQRPTEVKKEVDITPEFELRSERTEVEVSSDGPQIIRSTSLLSFPLLSSAATLSSSFSYSSMPLTAVAISGRRSFKGANVEIERLNDPSLVPPPEEASSSKNDKDKKKRKSEPLPITGRTGNGSFHGNTDEVTFGAGSSGSRKKLKREEPEPKMEIGANGFAKPKGFGGDARKVGGGKKFGKGKEPLEAPVWDTKGTVRTWDVGKTEGGSDSEDESDDEEEFGNAIDEMFKEARGNRAMEDDEMMMDEMKWDEGESGGKHQEKKKKKKPKKKDGQNSK